MPDMTDIELLDKMKQINFAATRILISAFEILDEQFEECECWQIRSAKNDHQRRDKTKHLEYFMNGQWKHRENRKKLYQLKSVLSRQ